MKTPYVGALTFAALLMAGSALAQPVQINGDEGYNRLARWESHLDDTIAAGVRDRSLDGVRAWRIQKDLDAIEARVVQTYYLNHRIDFAAFRTYSVQLRGIAHQLNEDDWGSRNVYGNGWGDDRDAWHGDHGDNRGDRGADRGDHHDDRGDVDGPPPRGDNYYREGDYERSCHSGNAAAGTIFGAIAGGLIGSAASHGNGGAVVGGVILGGLVGNALSHDIDCDDQRTAFDAYNQGLNGDVGREYRWQHNGNTGTFTPTREYRDNGNTCRDFHAVTYRGGQRFDRDGTACRQSDGNWRFR